MRRTARLRSPSLTRLNLDFRANYADSRTQIDGFPPPFFSFSDTSEFATAKEFYGYAGQLHLFDNRLKNRLAFTFAILIATILTRQGKLRQPFSHEGAANGSNIKVTGR